MLSSIINKAKTRSIIAKTLKRTFSMDAGGGFTYPAPRQLDGVVNIEMFATQTRDLMSDIWTEHHAQSATSMASVMTTGEWRLLQQRAVNTPFFVYPIMRETGHFMLLGQFQDKSFLFTFLDDFRKNPANAQPYLCITVYDELAHTHDAVLMRADICALATLNKSDSERLLRQVVTMYTEDEKYQHVYNFNKDTKSFDMDAAMLCMN